MTLKSLSWKGGSRCLIIAASPYSLPLNVAHWCALARLPTTSTLTPSPAGCLWSSVLLCLREEQAGHARAPLPLGAALPMTEGSWYIHTPAPSPMGGRTTRCLQHSISEGPGRVSTAVPSGNWLMIHHVVATLPAHPISFPHTLLACPGITSKKNYMHPNSYLRICF